MNNKFYISYYLPEKILTNDELAEMFKVWTAEKIYNKVGIIERHIAREDENVSDMAIASANALFSDYKVKSTDIDFVILLTQSPDYLIPTTACIIQHALKIPISAGAFDINLGCSAYIYGLAIAKSMAQSGMAKNILLITSEVYSKHIHPNDKSIRTIFGDGATATLINQMAADCIGEFVFGTDGEGFDKLIIPASGVKLRRDATTNVEEADENGVLRTKEHIFMDGPEMFNYTIDIIPKTVARALELNQLSFEDIDLFIINQTNKFMLDYLKKKMKIDDNKFYVNLAHVGNTVSSSIPIALRMAQEDNKIHEGSKVMLVGFGVGLSWGATILKF